MGSLYDSAAPPPGASRTQLRTVHNSAKSMLIGSFGTPRGRIIDMGCGRGGDIHKYSSLCPAHLLMVDASRVAISDAAKRMDNSGYVGHSIGSCELRAGDLADPGLVSGEEAGTFDMAFCMFVVHYFFGSRERLEAIVDNASRALKEGGVWVLTFLRGSYLLESASGTCLAAGPGWSAKVSGMDPGVYGSPVVVSLRNTIVQDGSEEFLVSPYELNRVCRSRGLLPIGLPKECERGRVRGESMRGKAIDLESTDLPNVWRFSPRTDYEGCDYTRLNVAMAFRKGPVPPSGRHP
jgi:SAM-dependent methyltransferase